MAHSQPSPPPDVHTLSCVICVGHTRSYAVPGPTLRISRPFVDRQESACATRLCSSYAQRSRCEVRVMGRCDVVVFVRPMEAAKVVLQGTADRGGGGVCVWCVWCGFQEAAGLFNHSM